MVPLPRCSCTLAGSWLAETEVGLFRNKLGLKNQIFMVYKLKNKEEPPVLFINITLYHYTWQVLSGISNEDAVCKIFKQYVFYPGFCCHLQKYFTRSKKECYG